MQELLWVLSVSWQTVKALRPSWWLWVWKDTGFEVCIFFFFFLLLVRDGFKVEGEGEEEEESGFCIYRVKSCMGES